MSKTNYIMDALLFCLFVIMVFQEATGTFVHVFVGISLTGAVITHLILHRKWISAVFAPARKPLPSRTQLHYVLNLFLACSFSLTVISGLFNLGNVGKTFRAAQPDSSVSFVEENRPGNNSRSGRGLLEGRRHSHAALIWHVLHHVGVAFTFLGLCIHLALHWKWIKNAPRQFFSKPAQPSRT